TTATGGPLWPTDKNVLIGREDSFLPRPFNGLIDEVAIYSRALSASELRSIVAAGASGMCRPGTTPTTPPGTPPGTPPSAPPIGGSNTIYVPIVRNSFADPNLGGTWATGLQVFNLDRSRAVNVNVRLLNRSGAQAGIVGLGAIPGNQSRTLFGTSLSVPDDFTGSAVISGDGPIVVIANQLVQDLGLSASYNGVGAPATKVHVPLVLREVEGMSTALYVQNTGSTNANQITITVQPLAGGSPVVMTFSGPHAPGTTLEATKQSLAQLGNDFQGSAVIESDQPLAVAVNHSNGRSLTASTGQSVGAGTLYGPLVLNNNGGFGSTVAVQNVGSSSTQVTISVRNSLTGTTLPAVQRTLAPGAAANVPMNEIVGTDRLVGSVTVSAGSGGSIIGLVTQSNPTSNQATAYTLFSAGSATVFAPLVQTANSGWNTGFQVQNVGSGEVTVTVTVKDGAGNNVDLVSRPTRTIAPGASETWFPVTDPFQRVIGSATATGSTGAQLVGIVNQINVEFGAVDFFTTYEAISP
ncbi:MAG: hypothetical protein HY329_25625, partial [Chloroflexi bacterium]|nr:hypothetical protein [Chloroflexota bacterium]